MPKGDKYQALTQFLTESGEKRVQMSFAEIERICGLPSSAYQYPGVWSNASETSLSYGWLLADYVVEKSSLTEKRVVFQRNEKDAKEYLSRPAEREKDRRAHERYCRTHAAQAECIDMFPLVLSAGHFYDTLLKDPHGRYRSWEHCYTAFAAYWEDHRAETLDYLALHLAWYLASWGMLRGGAFLLQKDYKIHIPAVSLLLEARWDRLRTLSREEMFDGSFAPVAIDVAEELKGIYQKEIGETPSDTLLTKILLGTLGCTPAYDRYFKWAVRETRAATAVFCEKSLRELGRFYGVQWNHLEKLRSRFSSKGTTYPPMKVLDMCFFQYGLEHQQQEM